MAVVRDESASYGHQDQFGHRLMAKSVRLAAFAVLVAITALSSFLLISRGIYLLSGGRGSSLTSVGLSSARVKVHGLVLLISGIAPLIVGAIRIIAQFSGLGKFSPAARALRYFFLVLVIWDFVLALITSA